MLYVALSISALFIEGKGEGVAECGGRIGHSVWEKMTNYSYIRAVSRPPVQWGISLDREIRGVI